MCEMDKSKRCLYQSAILALIAVTASVSANAQDGRSNQSARQPFSLTISARDRSVKVGSPIWVDATTKNLDDRILPFGKERLPSTMDQGGWAYQVDALDEKNMPCTETDFYRKRLGHFTSEERAHAEIPLGSGFVVFLEPGDTTTDRVDIGKLYDLRHPGKYLIRFRVGDSLTSNRITVTVTP